jgi:hypothetical protein
MLLEFESQLWLTDRQVSELEKIISDSPHWHWIKSRLAKANESGPQVVDPLIDLNTNLKKIGTIAIEYAKALAMLEQEVRRTHGVEELIRWLSEGCGGEFQSFSDRVRSFIPPVRDC